MSALGIMHYDLPNLNLAPKDPVAAVWLTTSGDRRQFQNGFTDITTAVDERPLSYNDSLSGIGRVLRFPGDAGKSGQILDETPVSII
ncbi:hypothetical protein CKAH01_10884 [Colletotrichum kahawae]|uniref:Uncharacterized protein n=1 Tax=Colletotrichum kahawae TaxID=34407 RepID=A0AAD9XV37_COLKA|nr:hypothetical protein CKAH01_10884 [Colletotrichum kahawae]